MYLLPPVAPTPNFFRPRIIFFNIFTFSFPSPFVPLNPHTHNCLGSCIPWCCLCTYSQYSPFLTSDLLEQWCHTAGYLHTDVSALVLESHRCGPLVSNRCHPVGCCTSSVSGRLLSLSLSSSSSSLQISHFLLSALCNTFLCLSRSFKSFFPNPTH